MGHRFWVPLQYYKYLGVFLLTDPNPLLLYELLNNEIISFFNSLSHIYLSIHELVTITNLLLVSALNYRLLAHDLPPAQLCSLQHRIWKSLPANPDFRWPRPLRTNTHPLYVGAWDYGTCRVLCTNL